MIYLIFQKIYVLNYYVMKMIQTKREIKNHNKHVVLDLFRRKQYVTIPEIASDLGLSNNTVMKIIDFYMKTDLVRNIGKGESTYDGGKKPNLFALNSEARYAIGIRIAHDGRLYGILTDLRGEIVAARDKSLPWNTPPEAVLDILTQVYKDLLEEKGLTSDHIMGIAIGTHGITDFQTGTIIYSPHNQKWGKNFELKRMVEERLDSDIQIFVDNQIRFQTYAEKVYGSAKDYENIIVLRIGFSAIAGLISENMIKRGKNSLLGSIGHMTLDSRDDEECKCGGRGCFGVLVHQSRIERNARQLFASYPTSLVFEDKKPDDITINDIFEASNNNDELAMTVMDQAIDWFAKGIHNIIIFYDPEIIIIQGKYAEAGDYFITNLRDKVNKVSLLGVPLNVRIEFSKLGRDAGEIGAAAFTIENYFRKVT